METKLGNQREMWAKRGHEVDDFTAVKKKRVKAQSTLHLRGERRIEIGKVWPRGLHVFADERSRT
jgi:hypothetical protein